MDTILPLLEKTNVVSIANLKFCFSDENHVNFA